MDKKLLLLNRLNEIGNSLCNYGHALALIGLGSVGIELDRLDEYSDLDFFAIVEKGYKRAFIENLDWLSSTAPIAYCFRNTEDDYKLLFEDGVFCEFAVFETEELSKISFARGRIIWKQPFVDESICVPTLAPSPANNSTEWLVGEALTNLYVGLCRYHRGEKLSAARFIQNYAVDRIVLLSASFNIDKETSAHKDIFTPERRYEQRYPKIAQELPHFVQGYSRSRESAIAIIDFLEKYFDVNKAMAKEIRTLCDT